MNGKKSKELRRKAHNMWVGLKPEYKKVLTVHQVYKKLKKDLKKEKQNGN